MISSYTNEFGITIEKYEDGARLVIPNKRYENVFCWIRLKDIPKIRNEKLSVTFRNKRYMIIKHFTNGTNSQCEEMLLELILGKGNARSTLIPICENPLTFDVRKICNMIERNGDMK
jgi:hypothetical protein